MSDLSERIAALPPEKRLALLRRLKTQREQAQREQARRITPQPRDGRAFPLSFAQERMWFIHRWNPESPLYNVHLAMWLTGPLDVARLEFALNALVARHETLRTTFTVAGEQPAQVIAAEQRMPLAMDSVASIEEFYAAAEIEIRRPFDLEAGPLLRARLYCLSESEAIFLVTLHHIVADGWALGVFARELAALYGGAQLAPLPFQYADFAVWQRERLQGKRLEALLDYWTRQLAGAPAVLDLPTDRPRPAVQQFHGAQWPLTLDRELVNRLRALGQQEGATLFMVLLAAFALLLSRLSGQEEVVVGTPVANRTEGDVAGLVGVFINTLALRVNLAGAPTFRELLGRARQTALDAYAHQALPFARLVEAMQPERTLSHAPFFQVSFGLQENPLGAIEVPGLSAELLEARSLARDEALPDLHTGMAMFDLTVHLSEIPKGVGGWIEYSTDLFDEATITRLARHYETLLAAIVAAPDARVARLPLLAPTERETLLARWNDTAAPISARTVVEGFAAQAARTPEALAVRTEDAALTYAGLDRRANRLAHRLCDLGVGPEHIVGIYLERSAHFIVALLGVLKAGGAYLPLDPDYPAERLVFMMEDAGVQRVITTCELAARLPGNLATLCLDTEPAAELPETPPASRVTPGNLAYVIYTSGSTGRPKGVMVPHVGLPNLIAAQVDAFGLRPGDNVLQFASFNFDASISEVFTTLLSGATLHLAPADALLPGPALLALLREREITAVTLPPSALAVLPEADLPALATLISAGESCHPDLPRRWAEGRRFLNAYGPTEATVCVTCAALDAEDAVPVIGRPIANVRCYVVDRHLNPVPVGVPGELLVGGAGVARGYLGRPALTAERFVPDLFSGESGARLYRTGDLARWRADGRLEFVGRIDAQVKVRGYRIEPGEIEAVLARHTAVQQVAVVARADRLVAYVVPAPDCALETAALESLARRTLPDYMVPSTWVVMDVLPLTPNDKVDRAALPDPAQTRSDAAPFVAPRNPLEELVAGIWADLLEVSAVGVRDNFFKLGGHSLLAARFLARIYEAFGIEVPLRALFEAPTVAEFALALQALPGIGRQMMRIAELYLYVLRLSDAEVAALLAEKAPEGGVM